MKLLFGMRYSQGDMDQGYAFASWNTYLKEIFKEVDCGAEIELIVALFEPADIAQAKMTNEKVRHPYVMKNFMTKISEHYSGLFEVVVKVPEKDANWIVDTTDFVVYVINEYLKLLDMLKETVKASLVGMDINKFKSLLSEALNAWSLIHKVTKE